MDLHPSMRRARWQGGALKLNLKKVKNSVHHCDYIRLTSLTYGDDHGAREEPEVEDVAHAHRGVTYDTEDGPGKKKDAGFSEGMLAAQDAGFSEGMKLLR